MKKALICLLLLAGAFGALGQEKPLTQAEYVKMLYALPKDPGGQTVVIETLRRRGISFAVTDGIRGLTRSKSGNSDDLRRALEEAERRRRDPVGSQLPPEKELLALIEKSRTKTLAAVEEMPDFVVKQQIQRSAAYAGTNNFRNLDRLVVAVSYRASGQEDYRVLSLNGLTQNNPESKRNYQEVGGTSSTGEFVTMLATIFKPESDTQFEPVQTDVIRGRKTIVYSFDVERDKARQMITAGGAVTTDSTITGMTGRLWVDRENFRVLRVESEATEIPVSFPVRQARRVIDYDWVKISDEMFLLPSISDVRLTFRESSKMFESRNVIRFKDYQKYGTDVIILDEDTDPDPEPTP